MQKTSRNCLIILLSLFCIASCKYSDNYYSDFKNIPDGEWLAGEPLYFEAGALDSLYQENSKLLLTVRHDNTYPYRNLWLFVDYISRDGKIKTDTVECQMADVYGNWYGDGFGSSFELVQELKPASRMDELNHVVVWQAMREDTIPGISDVGIALSKE